VDEVRGVGGGQPPSRGQIGIEHLIFQVPLDLLVLDGHDDFHASVKITHHPIRAAEKDLFFPTISEIEDAAVLKESPDDATDGDVLGEPGDAGPQHAHAAHD
jgi:hypothetical protein